MKPSQRSVLIYLILIVLTSINPLFCEETSVPQAPQKEATTEDTWKDFTPDTREGYDFWSEFMQIMSKLAFIVFILLAAAWVLKRALNARMEQVNQTSSIRILERRTLSPKSAIYLLEVLGNAYLVGETQGGLHRLADLPKDTDLSSLLPPDAEQGKPRSFSSVLDAQGE